MTAPDGRAAHRASMEGIHVVSGNLTLISAAGVACLFWSLLYAREQRLPALIISHVAWDIWIFLIALTA